MVSIRQETKEDWPLVEGLLRRAFYNRYCEGCVEHYLVHTMRSHPDFVPELDLVLEVDDELAGCVMFTKAELLGEDGRALKALTLGPVCIAPEKQRMGLGGSLVAEALDRARGLGYEAVVLFGSPSNYVSMGFKSCLRFGVSISGGVYPAAMMVNELVPGVLSGATWVYRDSPAMHISEKAAREFDDKLEPLERRWTPSQEEFYILSNATLDPSARG